MPASRSASVQGDPPSLPSPSRSKSSRVSSPRNSPRRSPSHSGLQLVLASAPPSNTPSTMHYISIGTLYDAGLVPMTILCFRNGRMYSVPIESLPARLHHHLDGFKAPTHNPDVLYTGVDIDSFVRQSSPLPGAASLAPSLSLIGHQPGTVLNGGSEDKTGATAVTDSGPSVPAAFISPPPAAAPLDPAPAAAPADDDDDDDDDNHHDGDYGGGGPTLPAIPPAFGPTMGQLPPLPPLFFTPGLPFGPPALAGSQQASASSQTAADGSSQPAGPTGVAKTGQRYVDGIWQADPRANLEDTTELGEHSVYPEGIPSHPPWSPPVKLLVTKGGVTAYDVQKAEIPCVQCQEWFHHSKMQGHIKTVHGKKVRCRICKSVATSGRTQWIKHYICLTGWNIRVGRDFYSKDLFEARGTVNS